ncbi:hypothetical protein JNW88_03910 [Micromonospora sp. ATA32]|nr:hypothetical protein [Micromonospora sp. ATA32]
MLYPYPGLSPSNVNKDAKYSVVSSRNGGWEVRLIYRVSEREKELLTTDRHERLVAKVNKVKEKLNGLPGGAFYINEYKHVLVPHPAGGCAYILTYPDLLKFDLDGRKVSPVATPGLSPGELWSGPHPGIRYVLNVSGTDIKYERESGRTRREYRLSDAVGEIPAKLLARRLAKVKNGGGGIYINEAREFFAPLTSGGSSVAYVYLGSLGDDAWFPAPEVPGRK